MGRPTAYSWAPSPASPCLSKKSRSVLFSDRRLLGLRGGTLTPPGPLQLYDLNSRPSPTVLHAA